MLTKNALTVLKRLNTITGGTEKEITYIYGKPVLCLLENSEVSWDFSEYDPEIDSIMEMLENNGAIKATRNHVFRLTQIGIHYQELQRLERREKWKERIFGFISGVAVAVIGDLIVRWLAG